MADEATAGNYLIDVKLGANGGRVRLRDFDELRQWVLREQEFWKWALEDKVPNNLLFVRDYLRNEFNNILSHLVDPTNLPLPTIKPYIDAFFTRYENGTLLHSSTPDAHFVSELRQTTGPVEAISALRMLLKQPTTDFVKQQINIHDLRVWRGIVAQVLFSGGISQETVKVNQDVLSDLSKEYSKRLADVGVAVDDLRGQLTGLVSEHQAIRDRGREDMAQAVKLAREQAEKQRAKLDKEIEEFKSFYSAGLALREPVNYWKEKSSKHWKNMGALFGGFIIYLGIIIILALLYLPGTRLADPAFWKGAGLEVVGLTLALFGVVVALARMLYKLAISQLHLHNDADERVTMVQAYLALREGGHADESHMAIVLERLFAPVSDGVVKDDFLVTPADFAKAAVKK